MIPAHLLAELRFVEVATTRAIRTARVGPYTSRTRGPGFEFDQHLPYRVGDDVRRIDWNVTARVGAPYIRQTHAERELNLVIAIDLSRSMEIGAAGRRKKDVLMLVAGSLLFSAARDQINVGLLAFTDRVLDWSPPRHASGRTWHLLEELWAIDAPPADTRLAPAIRHLQGRLTTTTVIVFVSDFLTRDEGLHSRELRPLATAHDVIAVVVEDAADLTLPPGSGFVRMRDVESGGIVSVALGERHRQKFAAAVAARRGDLVQTCHRLGIDIAFVRSGQYMVQPVIDLFARRRSA